MLGQFEMGKLVEHAPHLACVVVVVLAFLSHLKGQSCENRKERESRDGVFKEMLEIRDKIFAETVTSIHKDNMEQRILFREALKENSKAMSENTIATSRLSDRLMEARPGIQT